MSFEGTFLGKVVELDEKSSKPRVKFQLLKNGEWSHPGAPNKKLKVDDALLAEFENNFRAGIRGSELPTNEDHDDPKFRRSPAWIVDMERKPGELHGIFEFTDQKMYEDVRDGKVKYISPELTFGWKNPADDKFYNVMKGAAFTNIPFIKGMKPAQILNLSEILEDDKEFATLMAETVVGGDGDKPYPNGGKSFDDVVKAIGDELAKQGWDQYGTWDWRKKELGRMYDRLKNSPKEEIADRALAFENEVNSFFTSLTSEYNAAKVVMAQWVYPLLQLAKEKVNETYLDGPTSATEPHRAPTAMTLNESELEKVKETIAKLSETITRLADPVKIDDRTLDNNQDTGEDDTGNDRSNVDDSGRVPSGSGDPDAEDPDLPAQCQSCQKLSEGNCPFQGIDVKVAAAGDGNCPQYVSSQTQLTPQSQSSEGLEHQGGSSVHFNEENPKIMPSEITLEQLNETVTQLSETVQTLVSENSTLKNDKASLEQRVVLSEQQLKTESTLRAQMQAQSFVDSYVSKGKITPAQGEVVLNMLAIERGEEVHLNESAEPASLTALLSELLEANEIQVPITTDGSNATAEPAKGAPAKDVGLSEHEKLLPKMEERAKEMALAEGQTDWRKYMSKASREVTREIALSENGGQR